MHFLLPAPLLVTLGILVAALAVGGALAQTRWPRATAWASVTFAALFLVSAAVARVLGGQRAGWLCESLVPLLAAVGLPALSALLALSVFRRARVAVRIALALSLGAVGTYYAGLAALVVACFLTGDCL